MTGAFRRPKPRSFLNGPLPLLAAVAAFIALTTTGIAVFTSVRQTITTRANENLAAIAMLKVEEIERWLAEHRNDTATLARSPMFLRDAKAWLQGGRKDSQIRERLLHRLQEVLETPQYSAVCIHSVTDGAALLSAGLHQPDSPRDRSQALKSLQQDSPLFDDLDEESASPQPGFGFSYFIPVGIADGSPPVAVVQLVANPARLLFPLVQSWPSASPSAETLIVKVKGDSVVYLNPVRHRASNAPRLRMPLNAAQLLAAQAARGHLGEIQGVDYRNVPSLGYALRMEGTPWLLLAQIDQKEIYANFNRMALFGAIVTALSVFAGFWWAVQHSRNAARIERLSSLYATISKTNQAIIHSQSPSEVYRAVCNACVDLAGLRLAWVGIVNEHQERIVPVIASGVAERYLEGLTFSTRADVPEGQGPTGRAYRDHTACECADYQTDPAVRIWQSRAAEFGLACSISLPLLKEGKPIGMLCVYGGERNFFDREAVSILVEMANNISFAIEHFSQETQRKQLARAMERHVAEIADLYQNSPCGYHSLNEDALIIRMNDTELRWLGYERNEVVNRLHATDLMTAASRASFHRSFRSFKASGQIRNFDLELVRKDGSVLPVSITASAVKDPDGRYLYSRTSVFDMTDIQRYEAERAAHEERLRELSRRLVAVQEEERRQLVQTLHDSASPNLAAIQIILNTMRKSLKAVPTATAIEDSIEDAVALLEDTGLSIREVCTDLRPPLLDYAGLVAALDGYAHQFSQRTGIAVTFNTRGRLARLSPEVESSLFRITQEALTNCAKHAGATHIGIEIANDDAALRLSITDNGSGFAEDTLGEAGKAPGLGLITMRERTEFIGGRFEMASRIGTGTRIVVSLMPAHAAPLPFARRPAFRVSTGSESGNPGVSGEAPHQHQAAGGRL